MVYLLLADGFEDIEAVVPIDILRRANIPLTTVGVTTRRVTSSHGFTVEADASLKEVILLDLEMLVLPGGPGVAHFRSSQAVTSLIKDVSKWGKPIGAICAAPGLLAELGLLSGRRAVCFPSCEETLRSHGAALERDSQVVTDPPFVTAKAAGAATDFALALVSLLRGQPVAEAIRREIYYQKS
ncbi:MAG: DJ-1/PfpI family protein [Oscillospiraceae bacterium]|nr:DJ-1/PfpI family protein [Oscillospiraceae bacterium]